MSTRKLKLAPKAGIAKSPTGITDLDQITEGGLPKGGPTLVCGTAGCGKTVLAMEFLVRGATEFNEPGVFMAFEETENELSQNVASMGFDVPALCPHASSSGRLCSRRAQRDRRKRRVRSGGLVHPPGQCD